METKHQAQLSQLEQGEGRKEGRVFTGHLLISPTNEAPHRQQGGSARYRAHGSSSAAQGLKCELEAWGGAQELQRGEGEPSSWVWSSKGRVAVQGGAELAARAQDSSLCTATVMLSCFWIMMFLQQERRKGSGRGAGTGAAAGGGKWAGGSLSSHRPHPNPNPHPRAAPSP